MGKVCSILNEGNHEYYCDFIKERSNQKQLSLKEIMEKVMGEIDDSDALLVIIKSKEKSEGMLIEIGYAVVKEKKIILAIKKGLKTIWASDLANQIIEFEDIDDLCNKLMGLK